MALLGREGLLAAVAAAPGPAWLWGPAGVGRTAVLREARARWPGPSVWIDAPASAEALAATLRERLGGVAPFPALLVCVDDADALIGAGLGVEGGARVVLTSRARPAEADGTALDVPPLDGGAALALFAALIEPWYPGGIPAPVAARAAAWVEALGGVPAALAAAAGLWAVADPAGPVPVRDGGFDAAWAVADADDRRILAAVAAFVGAVEVDDLARVTPADPARLARLAAAGWLVVERAGRLRMGAAARALVAGEADVPRARVDAVVLERAARERAGILDGRGDRGWLLGAGPHLRAILDASLSAEGDAPAARAAFLALGAGLDDPAALLSRAPGMRAASPGDPAILREIARARRAVGDLAGAAAALDDALALPVDAAARAALLRERGVVAHRRRALDEARAAYLASLASAEAAGDARAVALAHGNLAAVDHDRRALPEAAAGYARALDGLRALGDVRMEAIFLGNRAVVALELEALVEARRDLLRALALLETAPDPRFASIVLGNLAMLELVEDHPDQALARAQAALRGLAATTDASTEALAWARVAAAEADRGAIAASLDALDRAEARLAGTDDRVSQRLVDLFRAFPALAQGRRREVADRLADARAPVVGLGAPEPALVDRSDDARLVARLLERRLLARGDALAIGPGGAWFSLPGAPRVDLSRLQTCARLLDALAARREASPGAPLDRDALFAAGWPDARIQPESAANRLNVALARLRAEGLRDVLLHVEGGWLLDPAWATLRVRDE